MQLTLEESSVGPLVAFVPQHLLIAPAESVGSLLETEFLPATKGDTFFIPISSTAGTKISLLEDQNGDDSEVLKTGRSDHVDDDRSAISIGHWALLDIIFNQEHEVSPKDNNDYSSSTRNQQHRTFSVSSVATTATAFSFPPHRQVQQESAFAESQQDEDLKTEYNVIPSGMENQSFLDASDDVHLQLQSTTSRSSKGQRMISKSLLLLVSLVRNAVL